MMKVSDALGGIGSEAISAVPVFEKTKATCGKLADRFLHRELHRLRLGQAGARESAAHAWRCSFHRASG